MALEQSIFKSTKVVLDIAPEDDSFDGQVLTFINGALSDLTQDFGIGPAEGFEVTGDSETWTELLGDYLDLNRARTWLYLKVLMLWDPPQTSFLLEMRQGQIDEIVWRMINKEDGDRHQQETIDQLVVLDGGGVSP